LIVIIPDENKQVIKVTGKVTDGATGDPLVGVSVLVEGTTNGAVTDIDGHYSINLPNNDAYVIFSFIGYNTERVSAKDKFNLRCKFDTRY